MLTLFGEEEDRPKSLKIVVKGKKTLSKNQQLFNRLTKKIENLEKENVKLTEKFSRLLAYHSKEIVPIETQVANARIQLAMALAKSTTSLKFTAKQIDLIRSALLEQCNLAFQFIEPTPEQEAFYDKWSLVSYQTDVEEQVEREKEIFAEYMSDTFGMDIDMDEFDDSPEGQARFYAKMKDQFQKTEENENRPNRKKTKKQQLFEESEKAEEAIKAKSIRSIFIALAKVLHPDTETNENLKSEKEEIMKKVTSAYDQKDLTTLLRLEMEWVHKTSEHLEKMTDDKLGIYISALKQQVHELSEEQSRIYQHPRNAAISSYSFLSENHAIRSILKEKSELQGIFENLNHYITTFEWTKSKKQILDFVKKHAKDDFESDLNQYLMELLSGKRSF
jgi:hypothetical protein